jgi:hypothetical protein
VSADEKLAAATRGGYAATRQTVIPTAPDPRLQAPEEISAFIEETAGRTLRGEIAPSVAMALRGLADSALRAFQLNLGRRLAELEELAAARAKHVPVRIS